MLVIINCLAITLAWPGVSRMWMVLLFVVLMWLSAQNCQAYSKGFQRLIQLQSLEGINVSDFDCPTWHFYYQDGGKCECYKFNNKRDIIKCRDDGATVLQYGQCMKKYWNYNCCQMPILSADRA